MNVDNILELLDYDPCENKKHENFLNAINDWPSQVKDVSEYYDHVKTFLNISSIDLKNIIKAEKLIYFEPKNTWKHESISELILFLKQK